MRPVVATAAAASAAIRDAGRGVYVHVPFCLRRCHYCDFNTYADRSDLIPRYVAALRTDIARVADAGPPSTPDAGESTAAADAGPLSPAPDAGRSAPAPGGHDDWSPFTSVFVGGGTPTLLPTDDLVAVLRTVADALPLAADVEVTVEANPETVEAEQMAALVAAGVDRVSIGAQSFAPHVLDALGRWHDPDAPLRAVETCHAAGVERLSLDLIHGTPAESDDDWRTTVATALGTGIGHLSAYALMVEPNTEYARRVRVGAAAAPDDDTQAARMDEVDRLADAAGLRRYELSNWARPGDESRHNLTYWRGGDWLAFGAGAHGHWRGRRWWSVRSPERYVAAVEAGASPVAGSEVPDADERRTERLLMGLRLTEGVERSTVEPIDDATVRGLAAAGLLRTDGGRLTLTAAGMRLGSAVTLGLL